MEGLEIDWKVFIGQLINFAILFFLLKQFVYGPFMAMLKKRREKIEEGVNKSIEAEEKLAKLLDVKQKMEADNESRRKEIISGADEEAKKRLVVANEKAEQERATLLSKAEKEAIALKEKEKEQTRKATIDNAFALAEKLLAENIDQTKNKKITEEFLSKI
jgi:F-type H+-transporting ATPase subunit b